MRLIMEGEARAAARLTAEMGGTIPQKELVVLVIVQTKAIGSPCGNPAYLCGSIMAITRDEHIILDLF
jgi:hypothetical protein